MKAMALNQVQNNQSTVETAQILSVITKAVESYSKNESLLMTVAIICALVVMTGVVLMSAKLMIIGVFLLILALLPLFLRWCREDL